MIARGRVQGVGFRWFVREHARSLDLAGRVRNLADGSVEVDMEGPPDAVEKMMGYLGRGPRGASVSSVDEVAETDPDTALPHPFAIER